MWLCVTAERQFYPVDLSMYYCLFQVKCIMMSQHAGVATFTLMSPIGDLELTCCKEGVHRLNLPEESFNSCINPDVRFVSLYITIQKTVF